MDLIAGAGVIGAGGFSKVLTAYTIYFVATRVMLENPLLRIPVLAAAALDRQSRLRLMHRVLGHIHSDAVYPDDVL